MGVLNIHKDVLRKKLLQSGATLVHDEKIYKRIVMDLPEDKKLSYNWIRVRDEGDKITATYKYHPKDQTTIESQQEIEITVSSFEKTVALLETLGAHSGIYQENTRELWHLDDCEITLDTWPFLEPFSEIEGPNTESVMKCADKLGFDWTNAHFAATGAFYKLKYGKTISELNPEKLIFEMDNPFLAA